MNTRAVHEPALLAGLRERLRRLPGAAADSDLLARLGRARLALLGEASHGPTSSTPSAPSSPGA
jgi:erythromycin esterase-like protein